MEPGSDQGNQFLDVLDHQIDQRPLGKPSISPMGVTTTCFTAVLPMHCSRVLAKFSTITIAAAPESFN